MFNHRQSDKLYTDNKDSSYYSDNNRTLIDHTHAPIFADSYFKGISCNNGIKKINIQGRPAYYDNDGITTYRTLTEYTCNDPDIDNGPVNNIKIQSGISDIFNNVIDCGNHPITYYNMNNGYIQYACGNNFTNTNGTKYHIYLRDNKSNTDVDMFNYDNSDQTYYSSGIVEDENINKDIRDSDDVKNTKYIMLVNHELPCISNDGVITKIQFTDNPHMIHYTCKRLANNNKSTKDYSQNLRSLKTDNQKLIQKINIQTDDYRNPTKFWFDFNYSSIPTPTENINKDTGTIQYNHPFVGVNCEGSAITSLSFEDGNIKYACGTPLTSLTNYEYTEHSSPFLYNYYDSGVIFDHVSCPNNSVLSGFSRTITKDGPKVKWICGVKK